MDAPPSRADARNGSRRARRRAASSRFAAQRRPETADYPRSGRQSVCSGAVGPLRGRQQDGTESGAHALPRCSIRGSVRSHRTRAASSRRWRSAAGRWRPSSSAPRAGSRASGSLSWRCSAPPTSFAAAARRSGSRRITIGSARCLPRRLLPTPCAGSTASWCRRSSRGEATTARRCSSTTGAPETLRTRRFRPVLPPRKRAPRSPSTGPRSSTGRRWRWRRPHPPPSAWREGLANALANAGRPAEAADAYLARSGRSRSPSAGRAPAARGRAVPHRRATSIAAWT